MTIEFLYFDRCPNHEKALTTLKEVFSDAGMKDEIQIIRIQRQEDVVKYCFIGSPSIRIDGKDLEVAEDESTEYSMRCRRYKNGDTMNGFPSKELIRKNLSSIQGTSQ